MQGSEYERETIEYHLDSYSHVNLTTRLESLYRDILREFGKLPENWLDKIMSPRIPTRW